ncbi:MAG: transcriptional repressor [Bacteroidetes bacterium]|nr:transcriptional repressor [Bacteroidota bacterium]
MSVEQHLRAHNLRVTDIRKRLFRHFQETKAAVSHAELELLFSSEFDRVTIYRTLNSFLDKGILHKIPNDSGSARYALCKEDCNAEEHIDNHVHFKCSVCQELVCLHHLKIPEMRLPNKFQAENAVLLYEGICDKCN